MQNFYQQSLNDSSYLVKQTWESIQGLSELFIYIVHVATFSYSKALMSEQVSKIQL